MFSFYKKNIIQGKLGITALVFIASGAVGNMIDRVFNGYVVDMFEFTFINFAIFNVADIFITIGGILLAYYIIFIHDKKGV